MSRDAAFSHSGQPGRNSNRGANRGSGSFLGFPLEGFGLFTSLLLTASSGFFTFFLHHTANYANSYLYFGFPAAVAVWTIALLVFGTLWVRAKIHAK
jgi:hypothetical protein